MTFAAILRRATKNILNHTGQGAFLRGVATKSGVHLVQNVEIIEQQGNTVIIEFLAVIDALDAPRKDDILLLDGKSYKLERRHKDNGYSQEFIVRPFTPPVEP